MRKLAAVLAATIAFGLFWRVTPARTAATLLEAIADPNSTGIAGDEFGTSLAVGSGLIVVGVPLEDSGSTPGSVVTRSGAAYVFDARSGQPLPRLKKPHPAIDDRLGAAVAVLGSRLAVGVPGDNGGASSRTDYGAVLLFDPATGRVLQTLVAPVQNQNAHFGSSLTAVGTTLLAVGAPDDQVGGMPAGAVYLFDLTDLSRVPPPQVLTEPNPGANDEFGMALAMVGGDVLVGAPGVVGGNKPGAAYLFTPGSGRLPVTFTNPDGTTDSQFGAAVAGVGANVLVGAPKDSTGRGSAWLFKPDGTRLQDLCRGLTGIADNCGAAVAGRGQDALVGAPGTTVSSKADVGVVYFFSGGNVETIIDPPAISKGDRFGQALAALGGFVAVAAPDRTVGALKDAGYVYVYAEPLPPGTCAQDADCAQGATCNAAGLCVTPSAPPPPGGPDCRTEGPTFCDGDVCTIGTCETSGACSSVPKAGVAAVDCRVARIAALLAPHIGAFRGPLVLKVRSLVARAQLQVSAVETSASKRVARRRLHQVGRTLGLFLQAVNRAGRRGRLDSGLASQFLSLAQDARAQIPAARASLH